MNKVTNFLTGAGIGAGIAYLFDSSHGRRRRAKLRDQLTHMSAKLADAADATCRDLEHRAYGTMAELRQMGDRSEVPDEVLVARVRATMGHYISHPSAINVIAEGGWVTVS